MQRNIHREITPLTPEDSFLVFDRIKYAFDFPVHFHPEYELNFIQNGKGLRRIIGDSMEEIGDIELVLVGPNLEHGWELHNCRNENIREITVQFHQNLFDERLLARRMMKPIKDLLESSGQGIVFSEEVSESVKPRIMKLSKLVNVEYFLELIGILQELAVSEQQRALSSYVPRKSDIANWDKTKIISEYVQENYQKKISLAEVAKLMNMSPVSFNRFIKKRTGKTLTHYVNDVRIGYAAKCLLEQDLTIAEIAFKCGFNNIANFNRIFKKSKNCTPSQYRQEFSGIKRVL